MKLLTQLLKKLDKIIDLLTAEKENREEIAAEKAREEKEKMLMEYARKHNKRFPAPRVMSSNELRDRPVEGVTDCVPYGLSDLDKDILKEFYEKTDNRDR